MSTPRRSFICRRDLRLEAHERRSGIQIWNIPIQLLVKLHELLPLSSYVLSAKPKLQKKLLQRPRHAKPCDAYLRVGEAMPAVLGGRLNGQCGNVARQYGPAVILVLPEKYLLAWH